MTGTGHFVKRKHDLIITSGFNMGKILRRKLRDQLTNQ